MAAREPGFDLRAAIARAEFTPRAGDLPALIALAARGEDDARSDVARALGRLGPKATEAVAHALAAQEPEGRIALARVLVALGGSAAEAALVALADDGDARVRRQAYASLGRLGARGAEGVLLARLASEALPEQRALVEALGKLGGDASLRVLRTMHPDDPELGRRCERAILVLSREARRVDAEVDLARAVSPTRPMLAFVRRGLEALTLAELRRRPGVVAARVRGPGVVTFDYEGPLVALFEVRTFLGLGFDLGHLDVEDDDEFTHVLADRVAAWHPLLLALTAGVPRLRVELGPLGKRRGLAWKVAAAFERRALANDPREATFEVRLISHGGRLEAAIVPRTFFDPRFAYRVGDVPAASHPTIAAALALVAEPGPHEVVFDPFTGSGTELVECLRLAPTARAFGTDLDPRALEVARENLAAAGFANDRIVLARDDATRFVPSLRPTLVVSNPPMGRRVHRGDVGPLLEATLAHVATVCAPSACLVWLSPLPRRTEAAAYALGMRLERAFAVDLGGFDARLERWRLP